MNHYPPFYRKPRTPKPYSAMQLFRARCYVRRFKHYDTRPGTRWRDKPPKLPPPELIPYCDLVARAAKS